MTANALASEQPLMTTHIMLKLKGVSLSIIPEIPTRRELFVVALDEVSLVIKINASLEVLEVRVNDLQIDSYTSDDPNALSSVLFYTNKKGYEKQQKLKQYENSDDSAPFIQFSSVRSVTPPGMVTRYKYIGVLVLEFCLCIDSSSIFIVISDLAEYFLNVPTRRSPAKVIDAYNKEVASFRHRRQILVIQTILRDVKAAKLYFDSLIVHPIKAHITFLQSAYPRTDSKELIRKYFWLKFLQFISLDDVVLRLNAFAVDNAMESVVTLNDRLISKLLSDLQGQVGLYRL